jgi:hypothetical protein
MVPRQKPFFEAPKGRICKLISIMGMGRVNGERKAEIKIRVEERKRILSRLQAARREKIEIRKSILSRAVRAWRIPFFPIPRVSPPVWYIVAFQAGGGEEKKDIDVQPLQGCEISFSFFYYSWDFLSRRIWGKKL